MYFQVCSNSTYPQHSGERYRTNGPLVFLIVALVFYLLPNGAIKITGYTLGFLRKLS